MANHPLALYEQLLRERGDLGERLKDPAEAMRVAHSALVAALLLGAFYGFIMGSFSLLRTGQVLNALTSMAKVPVLMLGTTLLCYPVLYVLGLSAAPRSRRSRCGRRSAARLRWSASRSA